MDAQDCPSVSRLEAFSRGESADGAVATHIESCEDCQQTVEEIRTNNSFLEVFAGVRPDGEGGDHKSEPPPPDVLPGYKIEGEIYRGGQGIVYRATQIRTKRPVAFKMLLRGSLATTRQRLRFEREAEIVATLRHPGIVTVYDAGYLEDGRFGFAMELIEGVTLDRWAGEEAVRGKETLDERLRLFVDICDAASYAHQQGVIHRDLKPANILIDSESKPHILDFGIAKALESDAASPLVFGDAGVRPLPEISKPNQTLPGEFAGTPAYASPEQVSGDPRAIDTRTDVYSLGVILYQLMTGRLPYSVDGSLHEVVERITHHKPTPPSAEVPVLDDDIDAIVLRALHKDKDRRYASVADLQRDVELFLDGRPIETRRDSAWYVVRKTVRRHWAVTSSVALAMLVLAVFAGAMTLLYSQRIAAEVETRQQLRRRDIEHGRTEGLSGDGARALDLLWRAHLEPAPGMPEPQVLRFGSACEPLDSYWALWEFYSQNPCLTTTPAGHNGGGFCSATSPDGTMLATGGDGGIRIWSLRGFRLLFNIPTEGPVIAISFAADGGSVFVQTAGGELAQWSIENVEELTRLASTQVTLSEPRLGAISSTGVAAILDGSPATLHVCGPPGTPGVRELDSGAGDVRAARFNTDGSLLAAVSVDMTDYYTQRSIVSVWSMPDARLISRIVREGQVHNLIFTPESRAIVWTTRAYEFMHWAFGIEQDPVTVGTSVSISERLCWIGGPPLLASADVDRVIRLWDIDRGELVASLSGHPTPIRSLAAPAGQSFLVSGGSDGLIRLWEYGKQPWEALETGGRRGAHSIAFHPDGGSLAWTKNTPEGYRVVLGHSTADAPERELHGHDNLITSVAYNRDGRLLASADDDGVLIVWNVEDGTPLHRFTDHSDKINSVVFNPKANHLASASEDNTIVLRDLDSGGVLRLDGHTARVPCVAFSPDGSLLASCSRDGTARLWDATTGEPGEVYALHDGAHIRTLCFSPDGSLLATGGDDHTIVLTDIATGGASVLRGHPDQLFALAFGPDGRVLVSGDRAGNLMVWDVENRSRLMTLPKHRDMVMSISISPDGSQMATCSAGYDPEVRLWDLGAFAPHIAGNLVFQAARLSETFKRSPTNAATMGEWMGEVLMPHPRLPVPQP